MDRGMFGWVVILPKAELVTLRLGGWNDGRFKALKASKRNWSLTFSVMEVFLISERSTLAAPSWRRLPYLVPKVLMLLPSCCALTVLNRVVSNMGASRLPGCGLLFNGPPLYMMLLAKVSGAPIWFT